MTEGDIVMLCRHLYESSACRVSPQYLPHLGHIRRFDPPKQFTRDDGTMGRYNVVISCKACSVESPEFLFVECVISGGGLQTADFMRQRRRRI